MFAEDNELIIPVILEHLNCFMQMRQTSLHLCCRRQKQAARRADG